MQDPDGYLLRFLHDLGRLPESDAEDARKEKEPSSKLDPYPG